MDATTGHELLNFMDAYSGYNQICMCPKDEEKMVFTMDRGLYYYKVMPFGLKNVGVTYQRLVNKVFASLIDKTMEVYIDDMLVKSLWKEDHVTDLREMFALLQKYNMKLNPAKCTFRVRSGKFLGFMINNKGIEANPTKVQALLDLQSPKIVKEIQKMIGMIADLSRFVDRLTEKCLLFSRPSK